MRDLENWAYLCGSELFIDGWMITVTFSSKMLLEMIIIIIHAFGYLSHFIEKAMYGLCYGLKNRKKQNCSRWEAVVHVCGMAFISLALTSEAIWQHSSRLSNIGSDNDLLPDGTKPVPEPMLIFH